MTIVLADGTTFRVSNVEAIIDPIEQALVLHGPDGVAAKFNWDFVAYYHINVLEV